MYNRYTCPLRPCQHSTLKFLIQDHPRSAKIPHIADFKSAYISLISGPRGLQCETTIYEIMGWESSDAVRFDLRPLLQGQMRNSANLKNVLITSLFFILEVSNVEPNCRKSWSGNLLMSDLTFGPSFKVKRWFTGFGELSSQWIQICIGSPMPRSSFYWLIQHCLHLYIFVCLQDCPYITGVI